MANLNSYYHQDYSGGLHDTASAREIKRNEASVLRNWDITYKGQLKRRDGLTLAGDEIGEDPIRGLAAFVRDSGKDLLCIEDTNLRYLNSGTWDTLDSGFSAGLPFWMENVQVVGKIFIGNEDNQLHSWDRGATTLNSCLTDLGAAVPHGNVYRWHKNHLFTINNVNISSTKYAHRIYWSAMGDPTTWDTTNDFFNVPGDGKAVTMIDLGDYLVIFKERAVQFLSGWGDSDWRVTASASNVANIDEQVGCLAPRGATRVGNEVWFVDQEGQIRRIYQTNTDAFRKDIISTKIQTTLSGINKAQLSKAVAWTHEDRVFFAFPNGSDTENSIVCVYDIIASKRTGEEAWTTYTGWTPGLFASYPTSTTPDLYMGDATTGNVYIHSGDDDNGVAIDARWDGREDDYDKPERFKRYKFGYITGTADSTDVDIAIMSSIDGGSFADLGDLNLLATGSRLGPTGTGTLGPTGTFTLGGNVLSEEKFYFSAGGGSVRGKTVKMSLRHSAINEQPTVNTFTTHYKERSLR